ncbi:glycosyltransferase family 2 protein, partial [Phenylobacterium sp.]|uniref:glycosyltransferase family 2 protein n=1 Tax=Phenylobacterium sp. TaxID=1871053 RepID=UPI002E3797B4
MTRVAADDKPAPQVSVVIVVYNSGPTLERCLASLNSQTFRDFEVILSDNASPDGSAQAAAAQDASLRLIENGENLGFAGGVNRGAAAARGRWLALLNPDAYAEPDWLEKLVAATGAYPDTRAFASRQLMADDATKLDGLGDVMAAAGFPFRGGYGGRDPGPLAPG